MGGKEAAAIVRQHSKHIPIIFLTGEIAAIMKESTKEFAPAHLLLKPCNKLSLIAVSTQADSTRPMVCCVGSILRCTNLQGARLSTSRTY
jgi:CheY-like chemotaxis protein